jgi:glycosyltransferase involved in cell wall biosynthesis
MALAHEANNNIRLLLVGGGALEEEIINLVQYYGLENLCALAGIRDDVPRLLAAADVFFFPSRWEGMPGAVLEALASGLPVVASDIPSVQEMKAHIPCVPFLTAPACDSDAHTEHILQILDAPIDRSYIRRRFAESPFTLEDSVEAYAELYGLVE